MQSFRTELEQIPDSKGKVLVEKDIVELDKKIRAFRDGKIPEEKFRSLRLARGVYGQRQQGVQMIRIKLPFGKVSPAQLRKIAEISDEYSNGNLHITTRQDVQIHHVSLDRTPELWARLEQEDITLREACGNTVRNVTAPAAAGIDPNEVFDVSPYAHAVFSYFLRKPFGQELGRKIKIAFSSSAKDEAYTFIHDIGFIPKIENNKRGFKVLVGGGLGAQPFLAQTAHEFLGENRLIPFIEALIRVFDRHGERNSRHKARIKYLIHKIGVSEFLKLLQEEESALLVKDYPVAGDYFENANRYLPVKNFTTFKTSDSKAYQAWLKSNVFEQKQKDFFGVYVKVRLGNFSSEQARALAKIAEEYAAPDLRFTIQQGILLKFVKREALSALYRALNSIGLADAGHDSTADITACPGTDTCNLGISNSTEIARVLEKIISTEFPALVFNKDIKIKISGCMNSCGQHGLANIGFHGSSFKAGGATVPALQLLLGGGVVGNGEGRIADKVIKIASKRAPGVLRTLLQDVKLNASPEELFNDYYLRRGEDYFYQLLKPQADNSTLTAGDFIDWGQEEKFKTEIGVGECAGVVIDLVATLFLEAEEKLELSAESLDNGHWGDSIYFSYAALINGAKALLTENGVHCNTQIGVVNDFDKHFSANEKFNYQVSLKELALSINKNEPTREFAVKYFSAAQYFLFKIKKYRNEKLEVNTLQNI